MSGTTNKYIYHLRRAKGCWNPTGTISNNTRSEPMWNVKLKCYTYGHIVMDRPLSMEDIVKWDLIPDPKNYLAGVMKG